jgi:protein-disulfide isomerase
LLILIAAGAFAQEYVVEGNTKSPVRVVAYEDLQCSDCAAYRRMLDDKLLPKYSGTVAFEHREFPLPRHRWARNAAIAARYFGTIKPELGIAFRRYSLANMDEITEDNFKDRLKAFARDHGADADKTLAALSDSAIGKAVDEEREEGVARGVSRTPTVFVNGEPFIERFSFEEISKSIDAALAATSPKK